LDKFENELLTENKKKLYMFANSLWGTAATFSWTESFRLFIFGDT